VSAAEVDARVERVVLRHGLVAEYRLLDTPRRVRPPMTVVVKQPPPRDPRKDLDPSDPDFIY
jgi:hypothetical protein